MVYITNIHLCTYTYSLRSFVRSFVCSISVSHTHNYNNQNLHIIKVFCWYVHNLILLLLLLLACVYWNGKQIRYHLEFLSNEQMYEWEIERERKTHTRTHQICACYYFIADRSANDKFFFLSSFFNRDCRVFRSTNNRFVVLFVTFEWIVFMRKLTSGFFSTQSFIGSMVQKNREP